MTTLCRYDNHMSWSTIFVYPSQELRTLQKTVNRGHKIWNRGKYHAIVEQYLFFRVHAGPTFRYENEFLCEPFGFRLNDSVTSQLLDFTHLFTRISFPQYAHVVADGNTNVRTKAILNVVFDLTVLFKRRKIRLLEDNAKCRYLKN
jgi:hypothetical protein